MHTRGENPIVEGTRSNGPLGVKCSHFKTEGVSHRGVGVIFLSFPNNDVLAIRKFSADLNIQRTANLFSNLAALGLKLLLEGIFKKFHDAP